MLSFHRFLCLPLCLSLWTVPCRIVLASPVDHVICLYHFSLRLFTEVRRSSYGPKGTVAQVNYKGPAVQVNYKGTVVQVNYKGTVVQVNCKGTVVRVNYKGTVVQVNYKGAVVQVNYKGSVVQVSYNWTVAQGATLGVTVSMSAFLACHQCYWTGSSLAWSLNLQAVVCGIFWSLSPGVFSGYSGFLPSFGLMVQPIK